MVDKQDIGEKEFSIIVTDGLITYSRTFKIQVFEKKQLGSYLVSSLGNTVTIENAQSSLDGVRIIFPAGGLDYNVSVSEIETNEGTSFVVESDAERPFEFEFPTEVNRKIIGDLSFDHYDFVFDTNVEAALIRKGGACTSKNQSSGSINKRVVYSAVLPDESSVISFKPAGVALNLNFYRDTQVTTSKLYIESIVNSLVKDQQISNLIGRKYNIYFLTSNSFDVFGIKGRSARNIIDTTFIYIPPSTNNFDLLLKKIKFAILHEFYHSQQYLMMGCVLPVGSYASVYRNISEGSANNFGFKQLKENDKSILQNYVSSFSSVATSPFSFGALISRDGIIDDTAYRYDEYLSMFTWDFFSSDHYYQSLKSKYSSAEELKTTLVQSVTNESSQRNTALVDFIEFQKSNGVSVELKLQEVITRSYKDEEIGAKNELFNYVLAPAFSSKWGLSKDELYKNAVDLGYVHRIKLDASVKTYSFDLLGLSSERKLITMQNSFAGFSTFDYPFFINITNEQNIKVKTFPHNVFTKYDLGTNLERPLNFSYSTEILDLGSIKFSDGGNELPHNTFAIDFVNPAAKIAETSITIRPACKKFPSFKYTYQVQSGTDTNGNPSYSPKENRILLSCGGKDCRVEVALCSKDFDISTKYAFIDSNNCPVRFVKNWSSDTSSNMESSRIDSPREYWFSNGIVDTNRKEEFFGPSPFTKAWEDNFLIICQVGGEYSMDFLEATQ